MNLGKPVFLVFTAASALLLVPSRGVAQDLTQPITLPEAIRLALERNPEVLIAISQLDETNGKIKEVRADAFPRWQSKGSVCGRMIPAS
jgi:outer membrane protein TolC